MIINENKIDEFVNNAKLNESLDQSKILRKLDSFVSQITVDRKDETSMRKLLDANNIDYMIDDSKAGKFTFRLKYNNHSTASRRIKESAESSLYCDSAINEAKLSPAKVGWNGEKEPKFPDGTPQMDGYNSVVSVYVGYESYDKVYYVVVLDDISEDYQYQKEFKDKDSAIKFGNKVLSITTSDNLESKLLKMGLERVEF